MSELPDLLERLMALSKRLSDLDAADNEAWAEWSAWVDEARSIYPLVKLPHSQSVYIESMYWGLIAEAMARALIIESVPKPVRELAEFAHDKGYWR